MSLRSRARPFSLLLPAVLALSGCLEPAPKLDAIPASGLALRVHVFGAEASDGFAAISGVRQNNEQLKIVEEKGDGELLVGLDQAPGACVEPTGLCEFRVAIRVRDPQGVVRHEELRTVPARGESCGQLCARALQRMAIVAIQAAATSLSGSRPAGAADGGPEAHPAGRTAAARRTAARRPPVPAICSVSTGGRLRPEEGEKRVAQVETLKRLGVLSPREFDCLRKGYLARL